MGSGELLGIVNTVSFFVLGKQMIPNLAYYHFCGNILGSVLILVIVAVHLLS